MNIKKVYYSESSPTGLRWNIDVFCGKENRIHRVIKDSIAGSKTVSNYYEVTISQKAYLCHRLIWEMFNKSVPAGLVIDHIDGNGFNNVIENLRVVPHKINLRNVKKSVRNKSGITGVCETTDGRWKATWYGDNGKCFTRTFSIEKYGYIEAKKLACAERDKAIKHLNENGAGYTERHGL